MITLATLKMIFPVAMVVMAVIGLIYFVGEKEPVIVIDDDSLRIKCLFGRRIAFSEITCVCLLHQSMATLGVGRAAFAYGMRSCKGNFESGLLYVQPESAPTLLIQREGQSNVYISYFNRESTESLYDELISRCANNSEEDFHET